MGFELFGCVADMVAGEEMDAWKRGGEVRECEARQWGGGGGRMIQQGLWLCLCWMRLLHELHP